MEWPDYAVLLACILSAPLGAQTTIGGGSCNSSTVNGVYAISITGRQVTSAGNFTNVFQANGSATFDGQSNVTIAITEDTMQSAGIPVTWSGSYSVQANCAGQIAIDSGGNATFSMALYNKGADFVLTGNDVTYTYSGTGNTQPASCSTAMFAGIYTFTGTGYTLGSGPAVNGALTGSGLLQFDGAGNVTLNVTFASGQQNGLRTAAGTYSVSSNCTGTATLTDNRGGSYAMSFSVLGGNSAASTAFYASLAQAGSFLEAGTARAIYGQPAMSAANFELPGKPVKRPWITADRGARS